MTERETPDIVYGRLLESAHISGYSFERVCDELTWLLNENRWKQIGAGYQDFNRFLATVDLSAFNMSADQRRPLVKRMREMEASYRAIGKAVGVSEAQTHRDMNPRVTKLTSGASKAASDVDHTSDSVTNVTHAPFQLDPKAIVGAVEEVVKRGMKQVEKKKAKEKKQTKDSEAADAAAKAILTIDDSGVRHEDFRIGCRSIPDNSVALIFTDPPYGREALPMFTDLASMARRVLVDGGSLVTYFGQYLLTDVVKRLESYLTPFWICCCQHTGDSAQMREYGIKVRWKPMLWFVKGQFRRDRETWVDDLVVSQPQKDSHPWQQSVIEAGHFIGTLTIPDEFVLDPFCGGGTTAVAAKQLGRRWLTFDTDPVAIQSARERLRAK